MKNFKAEIQKAGAVIKGALKDTYRYLGTVLLTSVAWFAAVVAIIFLISTRVESLFVVLPIVLVLTSPLIGASYYVTSLILKDEYVVSRDFFEGLKKFFWRSLAISGTQMTLASILVLDIVWFLTRPTWPSKIIGGVFIYLLLFAAMVSQYLFPVAVNQDAGFRQIMKNAALLTLATPFYSLVITIFQVGVAILCLRFIPPVFCMTYVGLSGSWE